MTRQDLKQIIKLRSIWKVDKRRGNYRLPSGCFLRKYLEELLETQLQIDSLGIANDGSIQPLSHDGIIYYLFGENELTDDEEQMKRRKKLIAEML